MSNTQNLITVMDQFRISLRAHVENYIAQECAGNPNIDRAKALIAANDIMYKYIQVEFKEEVREAGTSIPDNTSWQISDGTVFLKEAQDRLILTLADYNQKISRTCRVDEDRKGFNILSDKAAKELGYVPPKQMV